MDVDLVVTARPVMGARCLHHYAKGGYAPVELLDVRDAFDNARPRFGDRLHPLEVDLRRRFHQQLHSGDPAPARPQGSVRWTSARRHDRINALASLYSRAIASFGIVNLTE
jgi:hypothetical protein